MTYDVVIEPWIPVLTDSGELREMGLQELLCKAHTLRGVQDPAPTVEFGLYRLLTALVLDIFASDSTAALTDLLDAGAFDSAAVDAYFARYADRFDLFHPKFPFLQTGGMTTEPAKPLAALLPFLPSGTAASHFHHAPEAEFGVSPAVAARLLTMQSPFMTAGGAGLSPSLNGAPPWYVLLSGRNLFETLCLNVPVDPYVPQGLTNTPPAWRNEQAPTGDRCTRTSLREALTWRPRRIQLVPGGPGRCTLTGRETPTLIQTMKFTAGASCALETWRDPAAAYRLSKDGALILRPQEGKAIWRDTGPLALLHAGTHGRSEDTIQYARPRLVDQFAELSGDQWWSGQPDLKLTVYGMRTDLKMKVFEWQRETLSLPVPLIVHGPFGLDAQAAIDKADAVASGLRAAIKKAYEREGKDNPQALDESIEAARRFWAALRGEYETYLADLASLSPEDDAPQIAALRAKWQAIVSRVGRGGFEEAIRDLETDFQTLKQRVKAREKFSKSLFFAFATPDQLKPKKSKEAQTAVGGTP